MSQILEDCNCVAERLAARRHQSFMRVPHWLIWLSNLSVGWLGLQAAVGANMLTSQAIDRHVTACAPSH